MLLRENGFSSIMRNRKKRDVLILNQWLNLYILNLGIYFKHLLGLDCLMKRQVKSMNLRKSLNLILQVLHKLLVHQIHNKQTAVLREKGIFYI